MVAGCGTKLIKYVFFTFNFLFFVLGAAVLGSALWVRFDNDFQNRLSAIFEETHGEPVQLHNMYLALYAMAAIGALLFVTGFLGCCGACCESVCLLGLFFCIVIVLFCVQIIGAVYCFVKKDTIRTEIADWWQRELVERYHSNEHIRKQMDQIQTDLKCCGARGCDDFSLKPEPASCGCNEDPQRQGCATLLYELFSSNVVLVSVVAIAVFAIELLAMIFACILCSGIRKSNSFDYY